LLKEDNPDEHRRESQSDEEVNFCTVAHWRNGEIIEENLFYDLVGMLKQIGVM